MSNKEILNIFYKYFIKEAYIGRVKVFPSVYPIRFNTLYETEINTNYPTLYITKKEEFNNLLVQYINEAMDFYGTSNFNKHVLNYEKYSLNGSSPEKFLLVSLFANACEDDFLDPCEFLRKRIAFFKESQEITFNSESSELFKGRIKLSILKDKLVYETPYKMDIRVISDSGEEYIFPEIKFGIYNDTVYFYAMQSFSENNNSYAKRVNRVLYKIGEGFDSNKDNYELFREGNLKDVTPSFVVALNIAINYFHNIGYRNINVISMLPIRYNNKITIQDRDYELNKLSEEELNRFILKIDSIQSNITEKFLRTFLRVIYHYNGMNVTYLPTEYDSSLHIKLDDILDTDNNLLKETAFLIRKNEVDISRHF